MQIRTLWNVKPEFRLKVGLLALTFFFFTATQAMWRSLKASIFAKIVGAGYVPDAKIISICVLIPLILLYSKLVDILRRHQMVYAFALFHGIIGLILTYFMLHPTIGLANTVASPGRAIGWVFYMFMESFSAFLSTTFWSFANSINKEKDAKNHYGLLVAGSKIGGFGAAGGMWIILGMYLGNIGLSPLFHTSLSDASILSGFLALGSVFLICAALCIYLLMTYVPGYYMHGYEAVYQVEKKREKQSAKERFSLRKSLAKAFEGLRITLVNPYVLGIFSLSLFHDMVATIFDYHVLMSADARYSSPVGMAMFYAGYFFTMHFVGLFISLLGTTPLQRILGNRIALLLHPFLCMSMVVLSFFCPTAEIFFVVVVLLRAANYGLNHPIREVLYIPTTKEIKFKCKAWSDAFGSRIAKGASSMFYKNITHYSPGFGHLLSSSFTFSLTVAWVTISYFLGRTLQRALDKKQVIGEDGISTPEVAAQPK